MLRQLTLLLVGAAMVMAQRRLALPDPRSCANSKLKQPYSRTFVSQTLKISSSSRGTGNMGAQANMEPSVNVLDNFHVDFLFIVNTVIITDRFV
jgi:hypothetical protein